MKKRYAGAGAFFLVIAGFLFFTALCNPVFALEFGARGAYWFPSLNDANIKVDDSLPGTDIRLKDDLGLSNEAYPSVEVFAGLGNHHISFMYTGADYSGNTVISRNINFNGVTFTANTPVVTDLKLRTLDLAYQYDLLDLENILAGFSLGLIGKIKYIDAEASLISGSTRAAETLQLPIPMVGLGFHAGIIADLLEARASIAGIGYSNNHIYEASADISFTPFPFLDIHGGYKVLKIRVDESNVFFNTELSGPFVALTVGF